MRILTVSHFFESHGGGIERVAGHLCRQFKRLGANPVWAASASDPAPVDALAVEPLDCINPTERLTGLPMPIPGLRAVSLLSQQIRRSDAVVIHDALYATSVVAMLLAKAHRKPTILIQHIAAIPFSSMVLRGLMRAANLLVTRPMLSAADMPVFISDTVRKEFHASTAHDVTELLFNGVDGTIFHPGPKRTPDLLSNVELQGRRRVLFIGRYVEKKGLGVLRALAQLRSDLFFVLAGTGPNKPSEWNLANVHDVGPQDQDRIADLYRWADLLILPSVGEGFPLVIQEAMACGLPVICGAPADCADPDAGRWVRGVAIDLSNPRQSAWHCANAIDHLRMSSKERGEMSRYALQRYNWQAMAANLILHVRKFGGGKNLKGEMAFKERHMTLNELQHPRSSCPSEVQ